MKNTGIPVSAQSHVLKAPLNGRARGGNPFRGLHFFDFKDASIFHGRSEAIRGVLETLKRQGAARKPFVLVLGAGGSGKSSLIRAGVIPVLTEVETIEGYWPWRVAVTRPGAGGTNGDPFHALAAALLDESALPELRISTSPYECQNLATVLRKHPENAALRVMGALDHPRVQGFLQLMDRQEFESPPAEREGGDELAKEERRGLTEPKAQLALVVDQLEELFTSGFPTELQQDYLAALGVLVRCRRVFVIAGLRADFYASYQQFTEFAGLPDPSARFVLQPPTAAELREMIRLPAASAGLHFETDLGTGLSLDEALLEAVAVTPNPLLALELVLSQLYLKQLGRNDNLLRWSDYRALGELKGAVANYAEKAFSALQPEEQGAVGLVLRHLFALGPTAEGAADCRTVPYRDLISSPQFDDCQMAGAKGLVDRLIEEGFLRVETGPAKEPIVSLTHQALLREWPRACQWLSEDQDFLRKRDRLDRSVKLWLSRGCQTDDLIRPRTGLGEGRKLVRQFGASLVQTQIDFVHESRSYWKKRCRVRGAIGLAVLAGVVGLVTVVVAVWPGALALRELPNFSAKHVQQAQKNADPATSERDVPQSRLESAEPKALQAQKDRELTVRQRDDLATQLKDAQKDGELTVTQRETLGGELKESETKVQQVDKSGEMATNQREALQTQLKAMEAKAQQAQRNAELAMSQRDELQARLKEAEAESRAQESTQLARIEQNQGTVLSSVFSVAPSAVSTPSNTQTGSAASTQESSVKEFVLGYLRAVSSDDVSAQERFFARRVNFYGKGVLSLGQVRASTERYRNAWPLRVWQPQGEPQVLTSSNPGRYDVLQPFSWKVSNGSQHEEGSATLYFRIRKNSRGALHIVHIEQRTSDLAADRPASQQSQLLSAEGDTETHRRASH
jgi:hypothetical protein